MSKSTGAVFDPAIALRHADGLRDSAVLLEHEGTRLMAPSLDAVMAAAGRQSEGARPRIVQVEIEQLGIEAAKGASYISSAVILWAFALEIVLKLAHHARHPPGHRPARGHELLKLSNGLPPDIGDDIERRFARARDAKRLSPTVTARWLLERISDAFVVSRYPHENGGSRAGKSTESPTTLYGNPLYNAIRDVAVGAGS